MYHKNQIKFFAKSLRQNQTKEEKKLWFEALKKNEFHFRRQHPIGSYIVDFYCHKLKLAIELDGAQHLCKENIEYDLKRTKFLNQKGIKVLRFMNSQVKRDFHFVCYEIDESIEKRCKEMNIKFTTDPSV